MANKFDEVLSAAINDIMANGFDSQERVDRWLRALAEAARVSMIRPESLEQQLRDGLAATYRKMVDRAETLKYNPGVERFTLERVKPALRAELDRRIAASAELIKINRKAAIEKTLQRFQGWSTSIPRGGTSAETKTEVRKSAKKALAQLPFDERRVLIDQGHKLVSAINEIVATDGGAIAVEWRSQWRQAGYNYREDHKERDKEVYLIRDSWAHRAGLVKKAGNPYYDEIEAFGQLPFCRCYGVYKFNLRDLPDDMLTVKGRQALATARATSARADAVIPDTDTTGIDEADAAALARARAVDRMGFLAGLRAVRYVPDAGPWHSMYEDTTDELLLQEKFKVVAFDQKVELLVHEAGHRGQATEPRIYARFKRSYQRQMRSFLAMANDAHLEDYRRRGVVDGGVVPEVFAESYARAMTGADAPRELLTFWGDLVATRHRLLSKADAKYFPVWASRSTRCARCTMFLPLGPRMVGNACTAVAGDVNANGHCDLFEIGARVDAVPALGAEANRRRVARLQKQLG